MTVLEQLAAEECGCDAPGGADAPVSIEEALRRIRDRVAPVSGTETAPLEQAAGRVLAAPVRARDMSPPFDAAAMDGYAVDSRALTGEGPWALPVVTRLAAGRPAGPRLSGRQAARILTGAAVPGGADCVVRQEDVTRTGGTVTMRRRPSPGLNIRRAGGDMTPGQIVVEAGRRLGPREIAAAAAAGAGALPVRRRLRVALLVTGDEVRRPGETRGSSQIWDVNTPMLRAALSGPEFELIEAAHVADSPSDLSSRLGDLAHAADLIVTTGGVSVGDEDHVAPVLRRLAAETLFRRVAIKPGKPVTCGRLGRALWLGLPGNPLAAFVTWRVFGEAAVSALLGVTTKPSRRRVVTAQPIRRRPGRCELRPARLVGFDELGREVADFEDVLDSGRVARLPEADGLIHIPAEADFLPAATLVEFQPFRQT